MDKDIKILEQYIKSSFKLTLPENVLQTIENVLLELEIYKNKIEEIKKWCVAVKDSPYSFCFFIDEKEISTDVGYCMDLANPILEIIDRKEVENEK